MTVTYDKIATTTLGTTTATVNFSSISGSYTDLVVIITGSFNGNDLPAWQVGNGSASTTGYSQTILRGNGTSALSVGFSNQSLTWSGDVNNIANSQFNCIINFQNYSNTTTFKTMLSRYNNPGYETMTGVNLWRDTSAINYLSFKGLSSNSYNSGTTFTLYGIAREV